MKNIELTEEHKIKLLKICKSLFPEYYEIYFGEWDYNGEFDGYMYFSTETLSNPNILQIHWFEFCITHLINRLASKNIKTDILADCEFEDFRIKCVTEIFKDKISTDYIHPIDYLYEKFKKLK